jgi:cellobiose-specific phosphotransferase system component IIC
VKQTGKLSQQTIVAELRNGHILIMKTTEISSLHAIGQCLRDTYPTIRQAMAMDGGSSSDLAVSPALRQAMQKSTIETHEWMTLVNSGPTGHIGLPAVIGISPRRHTARP